MINFELNKRTPQTQSILDMDTIAQAIIEAEGDLALVSERLLGSKDKQDQILAAISGDTASYDAFAAKARAFTLIKTLSIFSALQYQLMLCIGDLKPDEAIKAFTKIGEVVAKLTDPHTATTNTNTNINMFIA